MSTSARECVFNSAAEGTHSTEQLQRKQLSARPATERSGVVAVMLGPSEEDDSTCTCDMCCLPKGGLYLEFIFLNILKKNVPLDFGSPREEFFPQLSQLICLDPLVQLPRSIAAISVNRPSWHKRRL